MLKNTMSQAFGRTFVLYVLFTKWFKNIYASKMLQAKENQKNENKMKKYISIRQEGKSNLFKIK